MFMPSLQSPAGFKSCISCQDEVLMKRVKVVEDHAWMAPTHLNFATLSVLAICSKHWEVDRCKVCLGSRGGTVYLLSPEFECKRWRWGVPRARDCEKIWRTLVNLIGTHDVPSTLHRLFWNAGWYLEECTFWRSSRVQAHDHHRDLPRSSLRMFALAAESRFYGRGGDSVLGLLNPTPPGRADLKAVLSIWSNLNLVN